MQIYIELGIGFTLDRNATFYIVAKNGFIKVLSTGLCTSEIMKQIVSQH